MSIFTPRRRATSMRLSASTMGRPRRFTSSARRRPMGRCTASTTQTTSPGAGASATRPSNTSRVMASSSVVGLEAVGARQIENAQRASVGGGAFAFAAFDGDARVVSDLLAAAGEAVEECGLAAIGDADQRDAQWRSGNERRPWRTLGERGAGVLGRRARAGTRSLPADASHAHRRRFGAAQGERRAADAHHQRIAGRATCAR